MSPSARLRSPGAAPPADRPGASAWAEPEGDVEGLYFAAPREGRRRALRFLPARSTGLGDLEGGLELDHAELLARARGAARALLRGVDDGAGAAAVRPGAPFLLVAATEPGVVAAFLGGLLAGARPTPIAPPAGLVGLDAWVERTLGTARALGATAVVGPRLALELLAGTLPSVAARDLPLVDVATLPLDGPPCPGAGRAGGGYVQLTSGSTALPRGVIVDHAQVAANATMIFAGSGGAPDDRVCSWLPLYHDMGLLGTLLFALVHGLDLTLLPPQAFLARPARWLEALSRHRATLSPAPSFAYPYVAHRARDAELAGLDLSAWRVAYCGAEPIHAPSVRRFVERLAPHGLRPGTLFPCYGLAEATLAVTFGPVGRGLREVALSRAGLARGEVAPPADPDDATALVLNGRPLPGLELELRDDDGGPCAAGRVGRVFVRGPSVTPGYWGDPEGTAAARDAAGWLDTGDLGALVDGELVVVGRRKDVLIVRGRNLPPTELEWAAQGVPGVRPGSAAAFSVPDAVQGTEVPVVVCEVAADTPAWTRGAIAAQVAEHVLARAGVRPRDVLLLDPGAVPKTTSGKVQRARARALYLEGGLAAPAGVEHDGGPIPAGAP